MLKKIALASVVATLAFTAPSNAAMSKTEATKVALYKLTCDTSNNSDRVNAAVDQVVDQAGGTGKLIAPMSKLKTAIRAAGDDKDLTAWCGIMQDQFDVIDAAVTDKLAKDKL